MYWENGSGGCNKLNQNIQSIVYNWVIKQSKESTIEKTKEPKAGKEIEKQKNLKFAQDCIHNFIIATLHK